MVLCMKSGPSFTGGACKLRAHCRSSSVGQGGKVTGEATGGEGGTDRGRGLGRSKLQQQVVGGAARGTEGGEAMARGGGGEAMGRGRGKRDRRVRAGPHGEALTLFLLDVYQLGDEVLQLGHALAHRGLQRFHPSLLSPGSWCVHVAHILDRLGVDSKKGQALLGQRPGHCRPPHPHPVCTTSTVDMEVEMAQALLMAALSPLGVRGERSQLETFRGLTVETTWAQPGDFLCRFNNRFCSTGYPGPNLVPNT